MRFVQGALVVLVALGGVACSGDDGGGGGGGERSGGDDHAGRGLGEVAVDIGSGALVGQTDTDAEHWDEGQPWESPDGVTTQRAYGGDVWSTVAGYPQAMNNCDAEQVRVSWRALDGELFAGLTDYASNGEQTFATPEAPSENASSNDGWIDVEADEPATEGELLLNACEQPVFRTTEPNVLVDYVIEVTVHSPEV